MRKKIYQRHCSDELLIAHLDGELSDRADRFVEAHLKVCWQCRAHLAELEKCVLSLATAMENHAFPAPDRIAGARGHFAEWARGFERDFRPAPQFRLLFGSLRTRLAAIGAAVVICLGVLGILSSSREPRPEAGAIVGRAVDKIIARTQEVESRIFQKPIYQLFRVETSQIKPLERQHTSRLEVWSEDNGRRFASVWRDQDGMVKHAVWRPATDREYIYNPAISSGLVKRVARSPRVASFAELVEQGLDPKQLEAGFMKWLEERHWCPISFAAGLSVFASQDGVLLQGRHIRTQDGRDRIWLLAQRRMARLTVELTVEIDANMYQPRLTRIRFETPHQTVEFCLVAELTQVLGDGELTPAVFEPNLPSMLQSPHSLPEQVESRRPAVQTSAPSELAPAEIETRYALHRAGACLGEQIDVVRTADGKLLVRGMVSTAAGKTQLLALLADLDGPVWLKPEIKTVDEAVSAASSPEKVLREGGKRGPLGKVSRDEEYRIYVRGGRLAVHDELERYLTRHPGAMDVSTSHSGGGAGTVSGMVAHFANQVVSLSEACLAEAWALRRIAERYGFGKTDKLPARSRWLLEVMVSDHLKDISDHASGVRRLLEPFMSEMFASLEPLTAAGDQGGGLLRSPDDAQADWAALAGRIFSTTEQIHNIVLSLFARTGPQIEAPSSKGSSVGGQMRPVAETISGLLAAFPELQTHLRQAEEAVASKFSHKPKAVAFDRDSPE